MRGRLGRLARSKKAVFIEQLLPHAPYATIYCGAIHTHPAAVRLCSYIWLPNKLNLSVRDGPGEYPEPRNSPFLYWKSAAVVRSSYIFSKRLEKPLISPLSRPSSTKSCSATWMVSLDSSELCPQETPLTSHTDVARYGRRTKYTRCRNDEQGHEEEHAQGPHRLFHLQVRHSSLPCVRCSLRLNLSLI